MNPERAAASPVFPASPASRTSSRAAYSFEGIRNTQADLPRDSKATPSLSGWAGLVEWVEWVVSV